MKNRIKEKNPLPAANKINFTFDGKNYEGLQGDTLASALLANGVCLMGRSFKYHRPRGVMASGVEEPNALVSICRAGGNHTPNVRATCQEIYDGMVAKSQNCYPSLAFDFGEINNLLSWFLTAGFYYKTFMWPSFAWQKIYEPLIRRAAGLGKAPPEADGGEYANQYAYCDVLVVGGGAAGLAAARAAAQGGQSVIVCDENNKFGGWLLSESEVKIDGKSANNFIKSTLEVLEKNENVRLLNRTTVFGYFQHNMLAAVERVGEHLAQSSGVNASGVNERLWQIRAKKVMLAQGALEKPMVFANNDRPGIMLAGAAQNFLHRYGVAVGKNVAIYTACDSAYGVAFSLSKAGCKIAAIIDCRKNISQELIEKCKELNINVKQNWRVYGTKGKLRIKAINICDENESQKQEIAVDCLLMSAGWTPCLHLHSQARGKLLWQDEIQTFVPKAVETDCQSIGACAGIFSLKDILPQNKIENETSMQGALNGEAMQCKGKSFIDFQNDVTAKDIKLAVQEGMHSIEHIKRYTTNGMATDQGKLSNMHGLAIAATQLNVAIPEVGLTTFRAPYTPVHFASFVNFSHGFLFEPRRKTSIDEIVRKMGAVFEPVGQWDRAWYLPKAGETMFDSVVRECKTVRQCAGLFDASTLGKIELTGPDCAEFLNLLYTNGGWEKLKVGKAKYGIMLREDGFIYDDGVVARMEKNRYHITTTTGGAANVLNHMEDYLQTEFPQLKVWLTSITEQYTVIAVQGPKAREIIAPFIEGLDIEHENFPHMSVAPCQICGVAGRLWRVSFTGELGFEINVPSSYGGEVWQKIWQRAETLGACIYGTETMHVLRAEKGYIIVGQDTDGTITPHDAGLSWAVGKNKFDFIGKRGLQRPDLSSNEGRRQLVGLEIEAGENIIPEGAQIIANKNFNVPERMLGFVTSSYYSPSLKKAFAMALIEDGFNKMGETVYVPLSEKTPEKTPEKTVAVKIRDTLFYDPKGEKLHV